MARKNETQEQAKAARAEVDRAERELAELRKEHKAAERAREKAQEEWARYRENGGYAAFGAWPSVAEGSARFRELHRLGDAVRAAEDQLQRRRERLQALEKAAAPLSDAARARLAELVGWADADAELAERLGGTSPLALLVNGQADRLRALADAHGVDR